MAASAWASAHDEGSVGNNEDNDNIPSPPKKLDANKEKGDAAGSTECDTKNKAADVKNQRGSYTPPKQNNYSLHLKNVPFDATQGDIRFVFGEKGCNVTSVRLVYDRDQNTGERHFRGVAFVDLADEKSYRLGLEFHNKSFLGKGRRVNVRPTRTKSELSDIVRRTEEKVATLIARSKKVAQTKKRGRDDDTSTLEVKDTGRGNSKKKRQRNKLKGKESSNSAKKSDQAVTSAHINIPEKKMSKVLAHTKKRGRDDDISRSEVKDTESGKSEKKQKRNKQKDRPDGFKKGDQAATSQQSNVPENKLNNQKEKSDEENKWADIHDKIDAPNTEPQSTHIDETTEGTEKTRSAKAKFKGRKTTAPYLKHDAPTIESQNDDTIGATKGHNKIFDKGMSRSRKHADSDTKSDAPTSTQQSNAKERTKGPGKKGKNRSKSKDGKNPSNAADVKLTKKQRAKKAAVIRMIKLKG
ncbi:hypothetical protein ACHAXA_002061 [Cyclostephanos tholiformis]|uniref:RRM domain-containing protein n=1 Tax=Cyclostephanos tholiformis TaxID=382380 RepID=A0ABD3SSI1_9STRA